MFDSYLNMQCTTLADCFVISGEHKWDTKYLIDQLFHTEWGINILKFKAINEYTCENFMYEGWERYLDYRKGTVYQSNVLWFAGYLYRYLCSTCDTEEVYRNAGIELIDSRYGFYHTQDWEYIKQDLGL